MGRRSLQVLGLGLAVVGLVAGLAVACRGAPAAVDMAAQRLVQQVATELKPLDLTVAPALSPLEQRYAALYHLDQAAGQHWLGTVAAPTGKVAVQVFRPPTGGRATVLVVHGYFDHAGVLSRLVAALLAADYAVVVYDQPGHGLSEGATADIADFRDYEAALRAVTAATASLPRPLHGVAHSLGCSVAWRPWLAHPDLAPDGTIVFLAPLVRPAHARLAAFGRACAAPFTNRIRRVFRNNSHDEAFCRSVQMDPLQTHTVPLSWCRAQERWRDEVATLEPCNRRLLVIQGSDDSVVDGRHGMAFVTAKLPQAEILRIAGGRHQLLNEDDARRTEVLTAILAALATRD